MAFTDDAGTATDADITNAVELTAGVAQLGGATAATLRGNGTTTDTVTGFSAPTIQFNAIEYETGTASTTTTGVDAVNQVSTFDDAQGTGENFSNSLSGAVALAVTGDIFKVTVGATSGATYQVTVGAGISAGQYTLEQLASDLTSDDVTAGGAQTSRIAKFDYICSNKHYRHSWCRSCIRRHCTSYG